MESTQSSSNRSLYLATIAGLVIVIIIFLISIPVTKKKYTSSRSASARTFGVYNRPDIKPLSSFLAHNKIVKFRSIGTGEYYKTDINSIDFLENNSITPLTEAGLYLNANYPSLFLTSEIFSCSPHFQKRTTNTNLLFFPYFSSEFDDFIIQKYNNPTKPNSLSQEQYEKLLNEGWYIIPAYPVPVPNPGVIPYTKPYLVSGDLLYSVYISREAQPGDDLVSMHVNYVFETSDQDIAAIDEAFNYKNVFCFKRSFENDNAFYIEPCLDEGNSFEITRHNFIHLEDPMNVSNIDNGEYQDVNQVVPRTANVNCSPLITREITDKTKISFYIEDGEIEIINIVQ